MMKYNQYPLNIEEIEENNEELYVKSENEIQIGTGDSKKDPRKKVYRILVNLKENLVNKAEETTEDDEETLREFSMKIYYYLKLDCEKLSEKENQYITLFVWKDLDKIIKNQTKYNKKPMDLDNAVEEFIEENELFDQRLLKVINNISDS